MVRGRSLPRALQGSNLVHLDHSLADEMPCHVIPLIRIRVDGEHVSEGVLLGQGMIASKDVEEVHVGLDRAVGAEVTTVPESLLGDQSTTGTV